MVPNLISFQTITLIDENLHIPSRLGLNTLFPSLLVHDVFIIVGPTFYDKFCLTKSLRSD